MSRRHRAEKREVIPDPKFGDVTLSKFMNSIMRDGKKSTAERIVYGAFDTIESRAKQDPLGVFHQALENVMPAIEVRSRRVGGATYQVPVEVRPDRRQALAIRWLITAARGRNERTMVDRLSAELHGRGEQSGGCRQEARGHAPDGRCQPCLLALPLVTRTLKMPRTHKIEDYRNFGIMAHIDAGKTTTTERILFYTGRSHKMGEVHDGAATMDWMEQEQERGITITSAATTAYWQDKRLNIIDTPGPCRLHHRGRAQSPRARRRNRAARCQCRRRAADGDRVAPGGQVSRAAHDLRQQDGQDRRRLLPLGGDGQDAPGGEPAGSAAADRRGERFQGRGRPRHMKAIVWHDESLGAKFDYQDIPADLADRAAEYREKLVELAVENDEAAMEAYLEGSEPDEDTLKALIRQGTIQNTFVPIFAGSAFKNKGVQPLLDALSTICRRRSMSMTFAVST
jgi:ribosomal protein S7